MTWWTDVFGRDDAASIDAALTDILEEAVQVQLNSDVAAQQRRWRAETPDLGFWYSPCRVCGGTEGIVCPAECGATARCGICHGTGGIACPACVCPTCQGDRDIQCPGCCGIGGDCLTCDGNCSIPCPTCEGGHTAGWAVG